MRIDKRMTDMLPKGVLVVRAEDPGAAGDQAQLPGRPRDPRGGARERRDADALRRARHRSARWPARGSSCRRWTATPIKLWDYWERNLDPDLFKDRSFEGAVNGRTVVITGASSGIGRAAALKIAAAGGIPLLVARTQEKLDEVKAEIEAAGGDGVRRTRATCRTTTRSSSLVERMLADHPAIDMLVNNAGRSIRRSVKLSYDRFHDFERTVGLNYLEPGEADARPAAAHDASARSGHIVNVSSIGAQTNPPRFSAYVASKAALDAWTRVASSEVIGDGVTFTTIHMPLVRTAMIAPTKIYDSFPTISPDEAADLICEAIRAKPKNDQHAPGHVRRGRLRARAEGRRPDPAHGLQGVPGVGRGEGREGPEREGLRRGDRARVPDARRALVASARSSNVNCAGWGRGVRG